MFVAGLIDEELEPTVLELVQRIRTEKIAEKNNAYFALSGFAAPAGRDIVDVGLTAYESDQRWLALALQGKHRNNVTRTEQQAALKFKGDYQSICTIRDVHLYHNGVCKTQAETDLMLVENRELLNRYYRLIEYTILEEPFLGTRWWQNDLLKVSRLAQADIEQRLSSGDSAKAVELLVKDLWFWSNVYGGKYHLISQAILQVGIGLRVGGISEMLLRWPQLLDNAELRTAIARPFPEESSILGAQMDREFTNLYFVNIGSDALFGTPWQADTSPFLKWFADRFYRKNATLNGYRACLSDFYVLRAKRGEERRAGVRSFSAYDPAVWGLITNLTGEIVLMTACPKAHWLDSTEFTRAEARRVLVMLQIMAMEHKISDAAMPGFLQNASSDLRDPQTGKPAMWDAKHRIIYLARDDNVQFSGLWVPVDKDGGFNYDCPDPPKSKCR